MINLERKPDADAPLPIDVRFRLFPKYVLLETVHFDAGKPAFTAQMNERLRYAARFILEFLDFPVWPSRATPTTPVRRKRTSHSEPAAPRRSDASCTKFTLFRKTRCMPSDTLTRIRLRQTQQRKVAWKIAASISLWSIGFRTRARLPHIGAAPPAALFFQPDL